METVIIKVSTLLVILSDVHDQMKHFLCTIYCLLQKKIDITSYCVPVMCMLVQFYIQFKIDFLLVK